MTEALTFKIDGERDRMPVEALTDVFRGCGDCYGALDIRVSSDGPLLLFCSVCLKSWRVYESGRIVAVAADYGAPRLFSAFFRQRRDRRSRGLLGQAA